MVVGADGEGRQVRHLLHGQEERYYDGKWKHPYHSITRTCSSWGGRLGQGVPPSASQSQT